MKIINILKFFSYVYLQMNVKEKFIFWSSLLMNIISGIAPSIVIYLSALIISKLSNNDFSIIYLISVLFVIFIIFSNLVSTISSFISDSINDIIWKIIKKNILYSSSMPYDISIYDDPEKRKLLTLSLLFSDDVNNSIIALTAVIFGIANLVPLSILVGLSIWWAPIIIVFSLVPFVYYIAISERKNWEIKEEHEGEFTKMRVYERVMTQPEFAKDIRLFNMQEKLIKRWIEAFDVFFSKAQKVRINNSISVSIVSILSSIILLIPVIYMINLYIRNILNIQQSILILSGIYAIKDGVSAIIYNYKDALEVAYKINPFLEFSKSKQNNINAPIFEYKELNEDKIIAIENLNFNYPQAINVSLKDINLTINKNSTVAIVGDNGAGKSTLIKLLCGFYNIHQGNIFWNGKIIKPKIFGMFQDFAKLPLSIIDNLIIDEKDNTLKLNIEKKLKELGLDFLMDNVDKILSPEISGIDLSFGQWQKLSLARVIIHSKEADLLIFDEPNSALDPQSEAKMIDTILEISKNKTSIIVSHRMAVSKFVDKIVVMDHGRIIEYGNHNELMLIKGKYFSMFTSQSKFYN